MIIKYTECNQDGQTTEIPKQVNVRFELKNSVPTTLSTKNVVKPSAENSVSYTIQKYSLTPNSSYQIDVRAELSDLPSVFTTQEVSIFVEKSDLLVFIEGGNR